jgi:hypothetical protein
MSTLEDKILGEKLQYYCSSSEGEDGSDDDDKFEDCCEGPSVPEPTSAQAPSYDDMTHWNGNSANTGPKGWSF